MAVPALLLAVAKRRALLRLVTSVACFVVPVLVMAMCGGLALAATTSAQGSTTACLTTASTVADTAMPAGTGLSVVKASDPPTVLSAAQVAVARLYIGVGKNMGAPDAALEIALMMSLQESGLRVLANASVPASLGYPHDGVGADHDSLGTAQQRPSAGWGSVAELMDGRYDAEAFYGGRSGPNHGSPPGLLDIPGWESMPKGNAAQAVQGAAFPELYAQWEPEAHAILTALKSSSELQTCPDGTGAKEAVTLPVNLSQLRREIINYAEEGVGGTYVWGGTAFKAWDCSGYVQWVYEQVGIHLPRTEQWAAGRPTSKPLPGDLVVQNPDGPNHWGHVGIYAGNGMMFSALNPAVGTILHPVAWNSGTKYFDLIGHE
ncbi:C40 family peptidase [Arthrobacter wenxiniae]|uniref:C40 family peptidase n=1 Tax=Arthrobacter wenxiniae TaxID=2713570 RepID=A0A7Y7III7_9MICC|nr:C40 family peptidase [Arthrobacter wenxiniae]NVM96138.1 C40 family peptidase [Arthrobacter wenxiniae]